MNRFYSFPLIKTVGLFSSSLMVLFCLLPSNLYAQFADLRLAWDRDFGGNIWEDLHAIEETADGGYILAGFSSSSANGDVTDVTRGAGDFWVVKTDDQGLMQWNRRYGGANMEQAWAVKQTADGGYYVAGWSDSDISGEKSENSRGGLDYWVTRIAADGTYLWDATYGGDSTDLLYDLEITPDGGFVIGGMTYSGISGEKTSPNRGDLDIWIVKADATGAVQWERSYGGANEERLNDIIFDTDGNFILAGGTRSDQGPDVPLNNYGVKDFYLLKVDQNNGDLIWSRQYGGNDEDEISSVTLTDDDGILLGGSSRSNVGFDKSEPAEGIIDMWIVKTDRNGNILWDRTFGGAGLDNCYAVKENSIGYYLVGGFSGSDAGPHKTENSRGGLDYWLVYLDPNGNKQWDKTLGGDRDDVLENLFQTSDGGYMLAGHSQSDASGDKFSTNKGLNDYWIIKTDCALVLELPDTMACPGQEFMLDAYDPQCIACEWEWDDGSVDSVRLIIPTQDISYAVTLTDGVGCARMDDIQLTILTPPDVDLGNDQIICPEESITLDAENNGFDFNWSTTDTTQIINVDSAGVYAVTVTDDDGCYTTDSVTVLLANPPAVDLGADTTVCLNESITLDAGNFPNADYDWSPNGNRQTVEIEDPGSYSVTVTDQNGCTASDTIQVSQYGAPVPVNVVTECNEANTRYILSFEIQGGDSNSYIVNGLPGTLNGRFFESDSIPKDGAYSFTISDRRGCLPITVSGVYDCECQTATGVLVDQQYTACGDEEIEIEIQAMPQPDPNDVVLYVLHDGDAQNIGTILIEQNSNQFAYLAALNYGQVYFVTMVTGNQSGRTIDYADGCISISEGVPIVFYPQPIATIDVLGPNNITCDNNSVVLDGSGSVPQGGLFFDWKPGAGGNIIGGENGPQTEVDAAADYILTIESQQGGCIDTAMYKVEADDGLPNVIITPPDIFTCVDTLLVLDAQSSSRGAEFQYLWAGPGLQGDDTSLVLTVNQPGFYTLVIHNTSNNCSSSRTVEVVADTLTPSVDAGGNAYLDCMTSEVRLAAQITTQGQAQFVWSTLDGRIVEGRDRLDPLVDQAGTYRLELTDNQNGCTAIDEVLVSNDPDVPSGVDLQIRAPQCFGEANGEILISNIVGGSPPILLSFNGQPYSSNRVFTNLSAGSYSLSVQDANGCEWDTLVRLQNPPLFILDLGNDIELEFGDSTLLVPFTNQPLQDYYWTPEAFLSQADSLITYARPIRSTNFTLTATDTLGCTLSETIQIKVDIERRVFIPNVFSPNFDGHNDGFTVFGGKGVEEVKLLRVLDRWGAVVFERENIQPNIPSLGWNGIYKGEQINPGVYVYQAIVRFSDGAEIQYSGDVTAVK